MRGLSTVPPGIIEHDLQTIGSSDDFDNATLTYGPDAAGNVYDIAHSRVRNWKFAHDCQVTVTQRREQPSSQNNSDIPMEGFRVIAICPKVNTPVRARKHVLHANIDPADMLLVTCNTELEYIESQAAATEALSLREESEQALASADAFAIARLPSDADEAYSMLAENGEIFRELRSHCAGVQRRSTLMKTH